MLYGLIFRCQTFADLILWLSPSVPTKIKSPQKFCVYGFTLAHALVTMKTLPCHHLQGRITTASHGIMSNIKMACFIHLIPCGMENNVMGLKFPAVPSPTCHGSSRHLTNPPMTLSSKCVVKNSTLWMKNYT